MQPKDLAKHTLAIGMLFSSLQLVYNCFSDVDWHFKRQTCMLCIEKLKGYTLHKYRQQVGKRGKLTKRRKTQLRYFYLQVENNIGSSVIFAITVQTNHCQNKSCTIETKQSENLKYQLYNPHKMHILNACGPFRIQLGELFKAENGCYITTIVKLVQHLKKKMCFLNSACILKQKGKLRKFESLVENRSATI